MLIKWFTKALSVMVLLIMIFGTVQPAAASGPKQNGQSKQRYIMVAKSAGVFAKMRADATRAGATVVKEIPQANMLVVTSAANIKSRLKASTAVESVATDGVKQLIRPQIAQEMGFNAAPERIRIDLGMAASSVSVTPDPAFSLDGLMWNVERINAPHAWDITTGDSSVLVGVADTGLDYTHSELATQVVDVVDLTDPTLCTDFFGASDADLAALTGGPVDGDFNGHGSWIGGNIAGALDGVGINGIAPGVKLVALKISEWCGSAYDSSILDAFYYASDHGIDVVSISFGGYLDRKDGDQNVIWTSYLKAVKYAALKGTVIVAAAGNEHLQITKAGQVMSHGPLTIPGDPFEDYYGLWEVPGGIPGVVDVSATGNVVVGSSPSCPADTTGPNATCKPASDAHQPAGVGKTNQLTYYSNYGPRIDVAAPGGARKFNVPSADRGGTGGYPYTDADGFTAYEDFSITSNYAFEIPCFFDLGPEFYPGECYSTIQGTSMATPHASAVLALIASSNSAARHHPATLIALLKSSAQHITGNATQGLSATDTSPGDRTGLACPTGYCHLGGKHISDTDAYGAGLVDAYMAVSH